jgi:hypothetical protein
VTAVRGARSGARAALAFARDPLAFARDPLAFARDPVDRARAGFALVFFAAAADGLALVFFAAAADGFALVFLAAARFGGFTSAARFSLRRPGRERGRLPITPGSSVTAGDHSSPRPSAPRLPDA